MIEGDRTNPQLGRESDEMLEDPPHREADEILADPSHPIWKIMLALVAVLAAAWGVQNGTL